MLKSDPLSPVQTAALWWWWENTVVHPRTQGYDLGTMHENKTTLEALERRGLVSGIRRGYPGGWRADVTPAGRERAEELHKRREGAF